MPLAEDRAFYKWSQNHLVRYFRCPIGFLADLASSARVKVVEEQGTLLLSVHSRIVDPAF